MKHLLFLILAFTTAGRAAVSLVIYNPGFDADGRAGGFIPGAGQERAVAVGSPGG